MNNLLQLLAQTAARFPDKTAVACREEAYTFQECLSLAARLGKSLSRALSEKGIRGKNHPIPVFVNRDAGTVIAFLAVLFTGNMYVALDPEMPADKLAAILSELSLPGGADGDIPAPAALSSGAFPETLGQAGFDGVCLSLADADAESLSVPDTPADAPVYMVYTSGSTGRPKGVVKSHGAVLAFVRNFVSCFGMKPEEIIGNQTPLFFDASAKDLALMLYTGATLEILPSELFILPVTLIRYMNEKKVTTICWVPSALAVVTQLNTFKEVLPETLKRVFFVGEVFPIKQLRKWMETLPELEYINLYGSTEQSGICCFARLTPADLEAETLPVGRPMTGNTVLLRGENGWITEPGVTGEIMTASEALAIGYFKDPEKTAAAFPVLPLPDGTPCRFLKTGDLARYDEEGRLHFVSRSDTQIKHMGRRIELGEIEAIAAKLPEIARCCCLYNTRKKQIILFAERVPGCETTGRELRTALKSKLAEYMVPAKVEVVEPLPQNANGKIHRQALKERFFSE